MYAYRLLPIATSVASALLLAALYYYGATITGYWGRGPAFEILRTSGVLVLVAAVLRLFAGQRAFMLLVGLTGVYLLFGLGIPQVASALLLFVSSLLLGQRLLAWMFPSRLCPATAAIFCGLAAYLTVFGVMIHFPVNYPVVYFVLLVMPLAAEGIAGRLRAHLQELARYHLSLTAATRQLPYLLLVTAVIGLTLLARFAFLPTLGFDDNALHLGLWSQLRHEHVYSFDYISQVWEVTPFAVDLLHASVNLVAGADARGVTNLLLLALMLRQLWAILDHLSLDIPNRLLLLALFISTPLTGYTLVTMQTELFMALLATTGVRLILELRGNWCGPHSAALLAIAALACATKLTGAGLGIMLLAAACLRLWSTRAGAERASTRSVVLLGLFALLLALLAFNAYATAWVKTGNPVFPLYNGIFHSPYFGDYNFSDLRWTKGFSLASYWDLFFHTSQYYESRDFVAGFQYLLLFPLGLVALLALRSQRRQAATLLIPLLGYGLFVFAAMQYWRYQFPVFPLATAVIGALLVPQYSRVGLWLVRCALTLCIALNVGFYPGISGFLNLVPRYAYTAAGKREMIEQHTPGRALTEWVNKNDPGSTVLYPAQVPYGATLHGTPVYVTWYSPTNLAAFQAIRTEADGLAFLRDKQVDYVIAYMNDPGLPGSMGWGLRRVLSRTAIPVAQANDHILYRYTGEDVPYRTLYLSEETHAVDTTPRLLGTVTTGTATALRYSAEFACTGNAGYFVAQINWNNGQYYYHRIPCSGDTLQFAEGAPIPAGASGGGIYVSVNATDAATLTRLSLETY